MRREDSVPAICSIPPQRAERRESVTDMRWWIRVSVLAAGFTLAACGSGKAPDKAAAQSPARPAPAAATKAKATPAQLAAEARGKVSCPAPRETLARAAGAPVDDVVGVRPGMRYEEAANLVLCMNERLVVQEANPAFHMQTYGQKVRQGFAANFMRDSSETWLPGLSRWHVITMGMPGEERVIRVAREEWFEKDKYPTVASVEQSLIAKYGPPTDRHQPTALNRALGWSHDPQQRPINEGSPLHRQCRGAAALNGEANFSTDCGIVVSAVIVGRSENPELAGSVQVSVIDQAGGYETLDATEQGLQRLEAQRRALEVQHAQKNASGPTL